VNGVSRTLERLVGAVEARGGEVRVITIDDPEASPDPRVERWPSIPFWAYPQLRMTAPSRSRALDVIEKWKPNLIHSATEFGVGLGGLIGARDRQIPFVTSYHTHFTAYLRHYNLSFLDSIGWPFLRWFHNAGRRTFAPSEMVRAELEANGFHGTRVWSRGVDQAKFNPSFRSRELRASLGADDETILVAYVGRIAPEKGIDVAINGMRMVLERHAAAGSANVRFVLVGDGPAEERCRKTAPPGTVFTGRLSGRELSEVYASADVFVFPSITETFGNVVLEAMASGLALVAPDWGATTELATTETALHFKAGDAASLAACVERLIAEPALRRRLVDAAMAAAATKTWDSIFDRLMDDYREALAE
jgi:phosphatidylinositol alpha 1,6-mannosyltransferase